MAEFDNLKDEVLCARLRTMQAGDRFKTLMHNRTLDAIERGDFDDREHDEAEDEHIIDQVCNIHR